MANAIKVDLNKFLAVAAELNMNVNRRSGDAKVYKQGTSGSSPSIQLLFGGKSGLVSGIDVVNCLVSSGKPHRNIEKPNWYGSVQQEIGWADEGEALKRFRDACLDINEGRAAALKKGGKGDYAPAPRQAAPVTEVEPVEHAEEQASAEEPLEQAAASVQ